MRVLALLLATVLLSVSVGSGQEQEAPPGQPPQLWRASASEQEGKVVIQIAQPIEQADGGGPGGFEEGVRSLPPDTVMRWSNLRKVALGQTAQAFRANGQRAEPKAVLKGLAEPKGVAVFIRTKESDPRKPDPFYLALLREETLVLVVNNKDIFPQEP